jgi:hemoglobin
LTPIKVRWSCSRHQSSIALFRFCEEQPVSAAAEAPVRPASPFDALGGHASLQAICNRFYDLMEQDPTYAELRAMHAQDLAPMRHALPLFLAGWSGGPRDWFEANPGRCMMSLHKPYTITPAVAGQWADAMQRSVSDAAPGNAVARAMGEALADMARGMGRP